MKKQDIAAQFGRERTFQTTKEIIKKIVFDSYSALSVNEVHGETVKLADRGKLDKRISIWTVRYTLSRLHDKDVLERTNKHPWKYYFSNQKKRRGIPLFEPRVFIPKIEEVLHKEKKQKQMLFRPGGPDWIDFQKKHVIRRREVNRIINGFSYENKNVVIVYGIPASGKSVVLRHVGYKASQERDVYYIDLKRPRPDIKDILELSDSNALLIIDDAHLHLDYVNGILDGIQGVSILVGTRDISQQVGVMDSCSLMDYFEDAIELTGKDISHRMINLFFKKNPKLPKPDDKITPQFAENNLITLSWQLLAYQENRKIDQNAINERVKRYMRIDLKKRGIKKAEDVMLPLSVFYTREIPVRKEFVELFANIKDIDRLIELAEIALIERDGFEYLAWHHSETARLFSITFHAIPGLGTAIKNKMKNIDERIGVTWRQDLYSFYIEKFPQEFPFICLRPPAYVYPPKEDDLSEIDDNRDNYFIVCNPPREDGLIVEIDIFKKDNFIKKILTRKKTRESILNVLREVDGKDVDYFIEYAKNIFGFDEHIDEELVKLIEKRLNKGYIHAIPNCVLNEQDMLKLTIRLEEITSTGDRIGKMFLNNIDIKNVYTKLRKIKDINTKSLCIAIIARIDVRLSKELFNFMSKQEREKVKDTLINSFIRPRCTLVGISADGEWRYEIYPQNLSGSYLLNEWNNKLNSVLKISSASIKEKKSEPPTNGTIRYKKIFKKDRVSVGEYEYRGN